MKKDKSAGVEHICANCEHSVVIRESDVCVCSLCGVVGADSACHRFAVDLLKLSPRPRVIPAGDESDFADI